MIKLKAFSRYPIFKVGIMDMDDDDDTHADDDDERHRESSEGSAALRAGVPSQGVELHLRQDRPHTSTLVAPGQQALPLAECGGSSCGANELHPVGTPHSLSIRDCLTMAKMVPG